jgi:hypothetical protein
VAWYLNPFLTSWRGQVNAFFGRRTKASDGTIGDEAHQQTDSQHNKDTDGSVDAWDADVNLLGSPVPTGTAAEISAMWDLIHEFERQPQAQLWIFRGQIANRDVGNWRVRTYSGPNKHDHHCHFQSRQAREDQPYTGDLDKVLPATNRGDDVSLTADQTRQIVREELNGFGAREPLSAIAVRTDFLTNRWSPAVNDVLRRLGVDVSAIDTVDAADIAQIVGGVLAGLDPAGIAQAVADALPADQAKQVADELHARLAA